MSLEGNDWSVSMPALASHRDACSALHNNGHWCKTNVGLDFSSHFKVTGNFHKVIWFLIELLLWARLVAIKFINSLSCQLGSGSFYSKHIWPKQKEPHKWKNVSMWTLKWRVQNRFVLWCMESGIPQASMLDSPLPPNTHSCIDPFQIVFTVSWNKKNVLINLLILAICGHKTQYNCAVFLSSWSYDLIKDLQ